MTQTAVKLNIAEGSIAADGTWTPPSGGGNNTWIQGNELDANRSPGSDWNIADWTTASAWGYYYTGGNGRAGSPPGQVDIPAQTGDYLFTVGPQGNDEISHIAVVDEASSNHYTISGPDNQGIYTISETEHDADTDHFYVWAKANTGGSPPTILCDPIIRNRN